MDNNSEMKSYCFFIYAKPHNSGCVRSFKVNVRTDKGKAFAKVLAVRTYGGNDIVKIEDANILI